MSGPSVGKGEASGRQHTLGITVLPEYVQAEGTDAVLERIAGTAGADSVTTSPYVAALAAEGEGHREPPADGGSGKRRVLDRTLWGRHELWMNAAPSFRPDMRLYDGLAYRPPEASALTDAEGPRVAAFAEAAKGRGLECWMQVQAAIPPCYRVQFGGPLPQDEPMLPDGRVLPDRVDRNASLASEDLRAYLRAFVADLWRAYPQCDGLKFDWPEYPVYHFDALFFDFNPAVTPHAAALGLDFEALRRGTAALLDEIGDGRVRSRAIALDDVDAFRQSLVEAYPVVSELLALRRFLVMRHAAFLAETVAEASGGRAKVFLQCFPPPLAEVTGFDLREAATLCDVIGVKFYTMHWPMIEADYLRVLTSRGNFAPAEVARALSAILELSPRGTREPEGIRYPGPDEAHPAASEDIATKMARVVQDAGPDARICAMAHGYGPLPDVLRRYEALTGHEVHMNRYGYLSDEKLAAIGRIRAGRPIAG